MKNLTRISLLSLLVSGLFVANALEKEGASPYSWKDCHHAFAFTDNSNAIERLSYDNAGDATKRQLDDLKRWRQQQEEKVGLQCQEIQEEYEKIREEYEKKCTEVQDNVARIADEVQKKEKLIEQEHRRRRIAELEERQEKKRQAEEQQRLAGEAEERRLEAELKQLKDKQTAKKQAQQQQNFTPMSQVPGYNPVVPAFGAQSYAYSVPQQTMYAPQQPNMHVPYQPYVPQQFPPAYSQQPAYNGPVTAPRPVVVNDAEMWRLAEIQRLQEEIRKGEARRAQRQQQASGVPSPVPTYPIAAPQPALTESQKQIAAVKEEIENQKQIIAIKAEIENKKKAAALQEEENQKQIAAIKAEMERLRLQQGTPNNIPQR